MLKNRYNDREIQRFTIETLEIFRQAFGEHSSDRRQFVSHFKASECRFRTISIQDDLFPVKRHNKFCTGKKLII